MAHSPTALSELKPRISPEILGQMEKTFRSLISGKDRTHKNHLTLLALERNAGMSLIWARTPRLRRVARDKTGKRYKGQTWPVAQ